MKEYVKKKCDDQKKHNKIHCIDSRFVQWIFGLLHPLDLTSFI